WDGIIACWSDSFEAPGFIRWFQTSRVLVDLLEGIPTKVRNFLFFAQFRVLIYGSFPGLKGQV
ncbi:MAG: hypothetical protein QGG28_18295, partial [Alphaproteobacteria bacterium]|nr:hypothetical protein [Alphaproteobacteria bacterium]